MMKVQKSAPSTDKTDRRRGRPAGKNRTPLSLEERRARNAQYERERRNETADAMAHLAEAACCDPQIANAELLATVISQFQRRAKKKVPEDIENLKRINENLESQIADLQSRLGQSIEVNSTEDFNNYAPDELANTSEYQNDQREEPKIPTKVKSSIQKKQKEILRSNKIRKTSKSSSVREKQDESDPDTQSDSSSTSNWSASVRSAPTQYQLRNRSQKVSEQSTTSTYPHRTSESSQYGTASEQSSSNSNQYGRSKGTSLKFDSEDSNQSDSEHPENMIDPHLATVLDQDEEDLEQCDKQTESALLNELTDGEMSMINQWLDGNETLNDQSDHEVDKKVLNFLDFKDFMFEINA